jgi:hypothetical protein
MNVITKAHDDLQLSPLFCISFSASSIGSSLQRPDRLWGPPSLLSNGYGTDLLPGVKRPGREADYSSPSSELKNDGATVHGVVVSQLSTGTTLPMKHCSLTPGDGTQHTHSPLLNNAQS